MYMYKILYKEYSDHSKQVIKSDKNKCFLVYIIAPDTTMQL